MQFGDARLPDRFWEKCSPEPNTSCWLWLGALRAGDARPLYWKMEPGVSNNRYAYRIAYEAEHGSLADSYDIIPRCSVGVCVNPAHLVAMKRGAINRTKARQNIKFCKRGHAFTPENTYVRYGGGRQCLTCHTERGNRYRLEDKTKEQRRRTGKFYRLWKRFGMTREMYDAMLVAQGERCAICRVPFDLLTKPNVDHDHATGAVRGLLCMLCNQGIGALKDDVSRLRSAIAYLKRAKEKQAP